MPAPRQLLRFATLAALLALLCGCSAASRRDVVETVSDSVETVLGGVGGMASGATTGAAKGGVLGAAVVVQTGCLQCFVVVPAIAAGGALVGGATGMEKGVRDVRERRARRGSAAAQPGALAPCEVGGDAGCGIVTDVDLDRLNGGLEGGELALEH